MEDWTWSSRVEEAGWITERSRPGHALPTGYVAYARLLHPISPDASESGGQCAQVRWAHIAAWSGATLGPHTAFWQIALPEHLPAEPMPGGGAPASHVLGVYDGTALARFLRGHTTTPQRCWFGVWDGYGWYSNGGWPAREELPPELVGRTDDPVPVEVRTGPRVRLPHRDYLLYTGPVDAGLVFLPSQHELADLWWPSDHAWFVYGDVDLNCTYVGGSATLVQELVESTEVEAIRVDPDDSTAISSETPDWLAARIETAVQDLMTVGTAELPTSRFIVRFGLGGPGRVASKTQGGWGLRYHQATSPDGIGWESLSHTSDLPAQLRRRVTRIVISLVEE